MVSNIVVSKDVLEGQCTLVAVPEICDSKGWYKSLAWRYNAPVVF